VQNRTFPDSWFTHANAKPGAIPGVAYDRLADIRSFAATRSFLTEIFADHGEI
jgi:hypothetical protein